MQLVEFGTDYAQKSARTLVKRGPAVMFALRLTTVVYIYLSIYRHEYTSHADSFMLGLLIYTHRQLFER